MLVPVPDMKIATLALERAVSGTMRTLPILPRRPQTPGALHHTSPLAWPNLTNDVHGLSGLGQPRDDLVVMVKLRRDHQAEAAIERAGHLGGRNSAFLLKERHQRRLRPAFNIDPRFGSFRVSISERAGSNGAGASSGQSRSAASRRTRE